MCGRSSEGPSSSLFLNSIAMSGNVSMRTLYFAPRYVRRLPRSCCVLNISSFLKELIIFACKTPAWTTDVPNQRNLLGTLLHQLQASPSSPLQLPRPADPRAVRVAEKILPDPGKSHSLAHSGEKIISAALEAGYNSTSAFIVSFKRLLGRTPRRYFETDSPE
jgi:hypothetical protein